MRFTGIDFETATGDRASICQAGLVRVEDGMITDRLSILIQPPGNLYFKRNTDIHGLGPDTTKDSPLFSEVYNQIISYIGDDHLVAHNALFDIDCFNAASKLYKKPAVFNRWYCTRKIYNLSLADACKKYGIVYTPHNAVSDAEAAARLMIRDIYGK